MGVPNAHETRTYIKDKDPKTRPCANCRRLFKSSSRSNRYCPKCKASWPK